MPFFTDNSSLKSKSNCINPCANLEDFEEEATEHKETNTRTDETENSCSEGEEEPEECKETRDLNGNVTKQSNNNKTNTSTVANISIHTIANTPSNKNMNVTKLPAQGFSPSSLELLVRLFPEKKKSVLELVLKRCGDDLLKAIEQCVPLGNAYINRCRDEGKCGSENGGKWNWKIHFLQK